MWCICVSKLTIIDSDNGLLPGRRQVIIWTNAGILLIAPQGMNFNEIQIEIRTFSFKKTRLKMLSRKWCPFCFGLNVISDMEKISMSWHHCDMMWFPALPPASFHQQPVFTIISMVCYIVGSDDSYADRSPSCWVERPWGVDTKCKPFRFNSV